MNTTHSLAILALFCAANNLWARNISADLGNWKITYDTKTCSFAYEHRGRIVLSNSQPEASCHIAGKNIDFHSTDFDKVNLEKKNDTVR